jgi:hypothetical protein
MQDEALGAETNCHLMSNLICHYFGINAFTYFRAGGQAAGAALKGLSSTPDVPCKGSEGEGAE